MSSATPGTQQGTGASVAAHRTRAITDLCAIDRMQSALIFLDTLFERRERCYANMRCHSYTPLSASIVAGPLVALYPAPSLGPLISESKRNSYVGILRTKDISPIPIDLLGALLRPGKEVGASSWSAAVWQFPNELERGDAAQRFDSALPDRAIWRKSNSHGSKSARRPMICSHVGRLGEQPPR